MAYELSLIAPGGGSVRDITQLVQNLTWSGSVDQVARELSCTLAVQWVTVTLMCPMMSLAATLIFKQPGWETPAVFLQTFACNFPVALLWQLFFAGPFCRWLLKTVFRTQKSPAAERKAKTTN